MNIGKDYIGVGCGALIINDNNETLLLQRTDQSRNEPGFWSKPGGTVEFGETVEAAIIREVKEETALEIKLGRFLGYTDHILPNEHQHWVAFNYLATIVGGTACNLEPHKHQKIQWFSFNDLPKNMTSTTRESIDAYLHTV